MEEKVTAEEKEITGREIARSCAGGECHSWENRLPGETAQAFRAFGMYRSMGLQRSIKNCLNLHEINQKKYGSWSRWSRLYNWNERAAEYDEFIAKETERQIIAEHVERRKHIMAMLNKVDGIVDRRLGTLNPEDISASGAMDLIERSAKLDGYVSGVDAEKENACRGNGQLEINFVDGFKDL